MLARVTHRDGSAVDGAALDYGMNLFREQASGVLAPLPLRDAFRSQSRFDEPDRSFGFRLKDLHLSALRLADIRPADLLEFRYESVARDRTARAGVAAAVGAPLLSSAGGARFDLRLGAVAKPASLLLLAAGAIALGLRHTGSRVASAHGRAAAHSSHASIS